jgi:NAD(P)-dependent dehydrogenase (short-subunit alcohol dehydrogenase family)
MALELEGKRALVTGSSSGIGEAIAKRLAREGARIVVHGRNIERAQAVVAALKASGAEAHVAIGDLAFDDQAETVADRVMEAVGGVDILVNNAGGESAGMGTAPWFDVATEQWAKTYQANVICAVRMIRRFTPGMKEAGWGRIINISSMIAHHPMMTIPDYSGAKSALLTMTISLSKALAHTGITANSICPGLILTPSVEGWLRGLAKQYGWGESWEGIERQALKKIAPNSCGRIGRPEDIAHAVSYLASPQASYVTGTDMLVCGG